MTSNSRHIHLDVITTSPHFPDYPGKEGFCSTNKLDLSHTGIKTKFEPHQENIIDKKNNLTSTFKNKSFILRRSIERDYQRYTSKENANTASEKVFLDKILYEMEAQRKESWERREKHWSESKTTLGFNDSFQSAQEFEESQHLKSKQVASKKTPEALLRKQKAYNRATLFKCLLDTIEPPPNAAQRFGSLSRASTALSGTSRIDSRSPTAGESSRWDEASILRASRGDDFEDNGQS